MKKLTLLLTLLLGTLTAWAQDLPVGILGVGDNVTTLETGKWYFLYNNGTKRYIQENANKQLKQASSPANKDATDARGYLVALETAEDGTYYIKTGLGNYYKSPASSARGTGDNLTASWAMTISPIADAEGHFNIAGTTYKLIAPNDYSDPKGGSASALNSLGDWSFRTVLTTSPDELTGKALYNYQMGKLGFWRLHCRRNMNKWLTSPEVGMAKCADKADDLSNVWYVQKNGEGYTIRSANNGQFLKEGFAETGSAATIYIRFSPNNKGDEAFINLSTKADFGNKCLNLMNDHTNLTTWTSEGDEGCDWAIELAEDVDMEQVREKINATTGYVSSLIDGHYYRINSVTYNKCMTETGGEVKAMNVDPTNFSQLWKVGVDEKNGAITLQNAFSTNYIQHQTTMSAIHKTGTSVAQFYTASTGDEWEYSWYITSTKDNQLGMHCDASNNIVLWYNSNANNKWAFIEVEVSDEDIANAQGSYRDYADLLTNKATYQAALDNLFADKTCSQLKPEIQALTDEQLATNADFALLPNAIKQTVLKVKNNTWQYATDKSPVTDNYEKYFRIADYQVYSHYQKMADFKYTGQSNAYGKLSNPTSVVLNSGEIAYIYVEKEPSADCTLQVEVVSTEGVPGGHQTGICTDLHQGLNAVQATEQSLLYIFYQLDDPEKFLADYPDAKIHIEGGTVQGYMDVTRGMTNQDWKNMLDLGLLSQCPVLNLKSKNLVFAMHTEITKQAIEKGRQQYKDDLADVERLLYVWNTVCANEEYYQGLEEFDGRFNNIWNVFSVNYNYMFATTYGTYYNETTLPTVMNYYTITHGGDGDEGGNLWGPSHEMGHNHQAAICMVGTMEASNNMFSNINAHEGGITCTRYQSPARNFDDHLAKGHAWNQRPIEVTTRPYIQLYFYFHVMKHDERFLQKLFQELRKDPIIKTAKQTSGVNDEGNTITGWDVSGAQDYLHFAKKCCDVAQADLSEFFEAYGFFVPQNKRFVGDYANYFVTTTQKDIDEAKKYMKKYPKKLGNIMFIDDHIVQHKADPDNKFTLVPAANGLRYCATPSVTNSKYGTAGNSGDYEEFDGHSEYDSDNDYYQISGNTISFKGKGYVGHKVYDLDGNLIWAVNKKSTTIPTAIRNLFPDKENKVVVVAAQQNMTDVPCPYYKSGTSPIYRATVSFADGSTKTWWANDNIDAYLPENAIAMIGSDNACEALLGSQNVVNQDGSAQSIVLNGDLSAHIPAAIQAQSVTFTKSGEGYQALTLPFAVKNAITIVDNQLTKVAVVEAGQPVVTEGTAHLQLSNVALQAGDFTATAEGYMMAADGKSTVAATEISPFTYVFDNAVQLTIADGINDILADNELLKVYDLSGRRVTRLGKPGIYVANGKKMMVK